MIEQQTEGPCELLVLKFGGSLITNKADEGSVRERELEHFAAVVARNASAVGSRMMIVVGGGSIGHFLAKKFGVDRGFPHCDLNGLHRMTAAMYTLKTRVAEHLTARGLPAIALQETSCMRSRANGSVALYHGSLRLIVRAGIVPIVSGGLVFDEVRGVRALNGDLLPLALDQRIFKIRRCVILTDVPGVLRGDGTVIRCLDTRTRSQMASLPSKPGVVDVTGGMKTKVDAALALARRNIPTIICDGRALSDATFADITNGIPRVGTLAGFKSSGGARIRKHMSLRSERFGASASFSVAGAQK